MQLTLLPSGRFKVQDQSGALREIGAGDPDFERLSAQYQATAQRGPGRMRLFGLAMIAVGIGGWWYNWHLAATTGEFYIKLCILGPFGIAGGLLMLLRPDWAGSLRSDSTRAQKMALFATLGFMFVASGIDFYRLKHIRPARPANTITRWTPSMGTPVLSAVRETTTAPEMNFLERKYRLGSFNQKHNPTWEFVPTDENIDDWKTLITIVDRPDARTREELDRLAQGVMDTYKSHGGQILAARTMRQDSGEVFNYMVAAFEEPGKHRFELNFVKASLGARNAHMVIYGVRITDPRDYRTKAKNFLDRNSEEVGRALGNAVLPDLDRLPRQTF